MARRKKDDGNGSSYESTDDPIPKKPARPIKLPEIQKCHGEVGRKTHACNPARFPENCPRERDLHLPFINGPSCNDRQDMFRASQNDVDREHQAKMEFVAAGMTRRYRTVNELQHIYISCSESCGSACSERRQLEGGCVDNSDSQEVFTRLSSAERELVLDKKRQAMLELKDRQTKFFKNRNQGNLEAEYLSGRKQIYKEKQHNEPLPVDCKELKAKKKITKERKAQIKHTRQIADDTLNGEKTNESQRSNIFTDLHKVKDSPLNYENATRPVFLSADLNRALNKENINSKLKAEPLIQTNHVQKCKILNHLPLPPIIQKTNAVPLPTIRKKYLPVQAPPPVLEYKQCMHDIVQPTYLDQKDGYQGMISSRTQPNYKMPCPFLEESEQVVYETNSSSISAEDVSCSDVDSLTDTGYIVGIHAHVVKDKELRKELRLDLSFAHTPAFKRKSKKTTKQNRKETKAKDENGL